MAGLSDEKRQKLQAKLGANANKPPVSSQPQNPVDGGDKSPMDKKKIAIIAGVVVGLLVVVLVVTGAFGGKKTATNPDGSRVIQDESLSDADMPSGNGATNVIGNQALADEAAKNDTSEKADDGNEGVNLAEEQTESEDQQVMVVTVPADLAGNMSKDEINTYVSNNKFESGELNEDGSVTYTMKMKAYYAMQDKLRTGLDDSIAKYQMNTESSNVDSITMTMDRMNFYVHLTKVDESGMKKIADDLLSQAQWFGVFHDYGYIDPLVEFFDDKGESVKVYSLSGEMDTTIPEGEASTESTESAESAESAD